MHAVDQLLPSRRFAAPAVAMAAAAAVAVAPMTASHAFAAPSLPPMVADITGAAGAVGNWAVASGLKFVTDPVTGLTKLVTDQVGNAKVIGDVLTTGGQELFASISAELPKALADAQKLIAAGQPGKAWEDIANSVVGPVLGQALNGMFAITGQVGPQIGPFADALNSMLLPLIGLALPPVASIVTPPAQILDGIAAATKALQGGDPFAAITTLLGTAGSLGQFAIAGLFGQPGMPGVLDGAVGLLPALLKGLADSSWAKAGPFTLPTGNTATFTSASPATLAASPTALPAFPDLGQIASTWGTALQGLGDSYFGENGIPRVIKAYLESVPKGRFVDSYNLAHATLFSPLLGLGMVLTETVSPFTPFLGPLGKALDGTQGPLIGLAIGAYVNSMQIGVDLSTAAEGVVKALSSGDPVAALTALITNTGAALTSTVTTLLGTDGIFPGLLPAVVGVAKGAVDGALGKLPEPEVFATHTAPTDTVVADDVPVTQKEAIEEPAAAEPEATEPEVVQSQTPATESPAAEAPAVEAPAAESPADDAPAAAAPAADAPAAETPAAETSPETPAESPATGAAGEPSTDAPAEAPAAAA